MSEIFGYVRVSTKRQNLDRQYVAIKEYCPEIKDENIFQDKESGRNFNREQYLAMKMKLRTGDILIIKSTDRLGRNKAMVKDELAWLKAKGVKLRILSIPTTLRADVVDGADWMMDMITNIIIEVYTSIDEYELETIRQRQREGIEEAKKDKTKYPGGQPKKLNKKQFIAAYHAVKENEEGIKMMTITQAAGSLGITRQTFVKRMKDYENGKTDNWLV